MANQYEDILKLQQRQQETSGVPNLPPGNPLQGLLQMVASVAQNTGNPNTERGQIFQGMGNTYLGEMNSRNKQQFFSQVGQISQAQVDPAQKINALMSLKAQHGTDYGLGIDDIAKQFEGIRGQDVTMRGQDIQAQNNRRDIANNTYLETKKNKEYKPTTREEAIEFESVKAGMKAPTVAQETTALYASRIKQANEVFDKMETYLNNQPVIGTAINSKLPNFMKDGDFQSKEQAERNFLTAVLRRESGAVISPTEFAEGRRQYFPQPGDKPAVLAQKKANRDLVMKQFIKSAGNAYSTYQETDTGAGGGVSMEDAMAEAKRRGLI